jgi:hypothetical protein
MGALGKSLVNADHRPFDGHIGAALHIHRSVGLDTDACICLDLHIRLGRDFNALGSFQLEFADTG